MLSFENHFSLLPSALCIACLLEVLFEIKQDFNLTTKNDILVYYAMFFLLFFVFAIFAKFLGLHQVHTIIFTVIILCVKIQTTLKCFSNKNTLKHNLSSFRLKE